MTKKVDVIMTRCKNCGDIVVIERDGLAKIIIDMSKRIAELEKRIEDK